MEKTARVTIGRVAERARVSKMTVSRVINQRPGVAPRLRARVQRVIDELGYVPSARARSLAIGRGNVIGLILPDIVSEWTTPLLLGVGEAAEALGFQMLVRTTGRGQTYTSDAPDLLTGSDLAEGVIVNSWRVPLAFAQRVAGRGGAIVVIDGYARAADVPWVSATDRAGACEAVLYLASLGHRRIGFIGGGREPYLAQERLSGFRRRARLVLRDARKGALLSMNHPLDVVWQVVHGEEPAKRASRRMGRDFQRSQNPRRQRRYGELDAANRYANTLPASSAETPP